MRAGFGLARTAPLLNAAECPGQASAACAVRTRPTHSFIHFRGSPRPRQHQEASLIHFVPSAETVTLSVSFVSCRLLCQTLLGRVVDVDARDLATTLSELPALG